MSLSTYDVTVPVFRQYLGGLSNVLAKAEAHCAAAGANESEWIGSRLCDDMFPFNWQIMLSVMHSAGAVANLRGETYPRAEGLETLAGCKAAVDAAIAYLDGVKPADLEGDLDRDLTLQMPNGSMSFVARDYLFTFAYGNFFFHVTTAYDLLRHRGLGIGKRDFLGAVKMKAPA
jgi:uncharacterized protein